MNEKLAGWSHSKSYTSILKRGTVTSTILQGSVLGMAVFNSFVGDTDRETECTVSRFANDTKLCGALDMLKGRDTVQRNLGRLERWGCANLMNFNEFQQGKGQDPAPGSR